MISETFTNFITKYIASLAERSRREQKGIKYGLDWVIYNLAQAKHWLPIRLPFIRDFPSDSPKSKTEPEYGIDTSFLSCDDSTYVVFVLKDEVLNNSNWTKCNFDTDLRKASYPDLTDSRLRDVKKVKVILAFNKDEDGPGLELFKRFVRNSEKSLKDGVELTFERWNLDTIVKESIENILTPDLLPQNVSGSLNYLCGLVAKLSFGSVEWENQVINGWISYMQIVLQPPIDERKIRLIPVSLIIISGSLPQEKAISLPGWIDLVEWAMIGLWKTYGELDDVLKKLVVEIWATFYISELDRYAESIAPAITTEHGLTGRFYGHGTLAAVNDGYKGFWILARLGLLSSSIQELIDTDNKQGASFVGKILEKNCNLVIEMLQNNPGCRRPLLDLDHIVVFLIWLLLWQMGRLEVIESWFSDLEARLLVRRIGNVKIPFMEGRNRLKLVAEFVATGRKPYDYVDDSSYFLVVLMELCFSLPEDRRDSLLERYYKRVVLALDSDGEKFQGAIDGKELRNVNLLWWSPPESWSTEILKGPVTSGISVMIHPSLSRTKKIAEVISDFVPKTRQEYPFKFNNDIPRSVLILCCLKYQCPLPSEFWRELIFPTSDEIHTQE